MRLISIIVGIIIAALGGVIAYRAIFIDPKAAIVITETGVREFPDTFKLVSGLVMLVVGTVLALLSARRGGNRT